MIIISDTSPISNLFVIDRLELLRDIYQQIIVPQAVFDELMKLQAFGYDVQQIGHLDWIVVRQPTDLKQVLFFQL